MSILKFNSQTIDFVKNEIMPYGKIGSKIDWNKVFQNKAWIYYPKPINWNKSVNQQGDFDADLFFLSCSWYEEKREKYTQSIQWTIHVLKGTTQEDPNTILQWLESVIESFKQMYFLWEREEIFKKSFLINLKDMWTQIKEKKTLLQDNTMATIVDDILWNIQKWLDREKNERPKFFKKLKSRRENWLKLYIKEDGSLNIDYFLSTLNGDARWYEDTMLVALYIAKCSKKDLSKIQEWVINALNNKIKKLDVYKIFIILERILPYLYENFKIETNLPEFLRPEYLSQISLYNIDLDSYSKQVKNKGLEFNRSEKLQNKLISQFKEYELWSDELRYRSKITSWFNEENFKSYLKDYNLGEEKRPVPNILKHNLSDQKDHLLEILK